MARDNSFIEGLRKMVEEPQTKEEQVVLAQKSHKNKKLSDTERMLEDLQKDLEKKFEELFGSMESDEEEERYPFYIGEDEDLDEEEDLEDEDQIGFEQILKRVHLIRDWIPLYDEEEGEIYYEFPERVEYQGDWYVALLFPDSFGDNERVDILKVESEDHGGVRGSYAWIESEEIQKEVRKIFCEKYKDQFDFPEE